MSPEAPRPLSTYLFHRNFDLFLCLHTRGPSTGSWTFPSPQPLTCRISPGGSTKLDYNPSLVRVSNLPDQFDFRRFVSPLSSSKPSTESSGAHLLVSVCLSFVPPVRPLQRHQVLLFYAVFGMSSLSSRSSVEVVTGVNGKSGRRQNAECLVRVRVESWTQIDNGDEPYGFQNYVHRVRSGRDWRFNREGRCKSDRTGVKVITM